MMNEIYQRGPIACAMAVPDELVNYTGGVYVDTTGNLELDHDISVVGWGVEDGTKYWLIRNSWGSYWGENGMLKLIRGINNLNIEGYCSWAEPKDTWTTDERNTTTPDQPTQNYEKTSETVAISALS